MATNYGNILTLRGKTTPNYDVFTLVTMETNKQWNYDTAPVVAGSFVIGIEYQIAVAGTTDFTLIGAANSTPGTKFKATGVGSGTGTATVAGVTRVAQLLPASGQVSFNHSLPDTAPIGGQPQTHGSPNVTQEFIVEVLYLQGAGPDITQTFDWYRILARDACNTAFGLAMT